MFFAGTMKVELRQMVTIVADVQKSHGVFHCARATATSVPTMTVNISVTRAAVTVTSWPRLYKGITANTSFADEASQCPLQ